MEIIVTLRKSLNLAGPLYSRSGHRSRSGLYSQLHCAQAGGRDTQAGPQPGNASSMISINGGLQGGLRRVVGDELGF